MTLPENAIAVVGIGLRFPDAKSAPDFWKNLRDGVRSIRDYSDEDLLQAGVSQIDLDDPHYVRSGAPLEDMDRFDAEFFGFSPKEAAIMDPQHRKFLQCCWEAIEDSTHPPSQFDGSIGVFAGCGMNSYFMFNLLRNSAIRDSVGMFLLRHTGNDKDFLTTRVSYCLNLTGPSVNIQTACSTSLVAIHNAVQSLLAGECELAIAGGSTIELPHRVGYHYRSGEVLSPDGHCRAFDENAMGTVFGSGAAAVVLRRLEDAVDDGDRIYAVIRGSAINNDGANKAGYLAPSVDQQAAAASEALAIADVDAGSIGYVAAHGTGTPIGDPIEIAALSTAFRETTERRGFCAISSVKPNIGHLDTASGVASFIAAVMAIYRGEIPPSVDFHAANSAIDFANSPFRVSKALASWETTASPRRAMVNSLGVGGTNANVILEQAPPPIQTTSPTRREQIITLSARNPHSLDEQCDRLADHLEQNPEVDLADVGYTLHVGREAFEHRRVLVSSDRQQAIAALRTRDSRRVFTHYADAKQNSFTFMFPGGGAQYAQMGCGLYDHEPIFRKWIDRGFETLAPLIDVDLRQLVFNRDVSDADAKQQFERPGIQLPAIFLWEIATAQLWMSYGIKPTALIGHSMGENTAACLAGVIDFEDALRWVVLRGQLLQRVPAGGMMTVALPASEVAVLAGESLDLAVENGPSMCVVSGTDGALAEFAERIKTQDVESKRIPIRIAAHSRLLDPVLPEFRAFLEAVRLSPPKIPFVSNRTGTWITDAEATSADYWCEQLRHTVQFSKCLETVACDESSVFVEVGPGKILSALARQHPSIAPKRTVLSSLRHANEAIDDTTFFLSTYARMWAAGLPIDLKSQWAGETRKRISLPTYAFQQDRYWIDATDESVKTDKRVRKPLQKNEDFQQWFYQSKWRERTESTQPDPDGSGKSWLMFIDDAGIGQTMANQLRERGDKVVVVRRGDIFHPVSPSEFVIVPELGRDQYVQLAQQLSQNDFVPDRIVYLWPITKDCSYRPGSTFAMRIQEEGIIGLTLTIQAMAGIIEDTPCSVVMVANGMQSVNGDPIPFPEKATALGPVRVAPREYTNLQTLAVDIPLPSSDQQRAAIAELLIRESAMPSSGEVRAIRGSKVFEKSLEPVCLDQPSPNSLLRTGGTYLITGGFGGMGRSLATLLASKYQANLVLLARRPLSSSTTNTRSDSIQHDLRQRFVKQLESSGSKVLVATADVAHPAEMQKVLTEVKKQFPKISGIFHTAGELDDDLIATATVDSIQNALAAKVHGTQLLEAFLDHESLDFLVLCSSTSTYLGPAGQSAYVGANEFLNAFADAKSAASTAPRIVSINWGVWRDVGMGAAAYNRMHGNRNDHDNNDHDNDCSEDHAAPANHPLFDTCRVDESSGQNVFTATRSVAKHWELDEHRTANGKAVLPGTAYLELVVTAAREITNAASVHVDKMSFLKPCVVDDDAEVEIRVRLSRTGSANSFTIESRVSRMSQWDLNAVGNWSVGNTVSPKADLEMPPLPCCSCDPATQKRDPQSSPITRQSQMLRFGPRWDCYDCLHYSDGQAFASLSIPGEFQNDLKTHPLHPALLDMATGFGLPLSSNYHSESGLYVPIGYAAADVYGSLTETVRSYITLSESPTAGTDVISLDIRVTDQSGNLIVQIERLQMQPVDSLRFGNVEPAESATTSQTSLSDSEAIFDESYQLGIRPDEGQQVCEWLLQNSSVSQVCVSPVDLNELRLRMNELGESSPESDIKFSRPKLETGYTPPQTRTEKSLAGLWADLLGIDQIGCDDNFFDLGGHSLLAVRLFSKIRKTHGVELPLSSLFEAPTITTLAAMIDQASGRSETSEAKTCQPTSSRFLVPLHLPDNTVKPPLFVVAGMFGNVLNLRYLANRLGDDQRVYGIQSKGLIGDDSPHETFEAMARDYLSEVRQVQPSGPYFLSGFSGGGVSAYEMAQQLVAVGEQVAFLGLLDTPAVERPSLTRLDKLKIHLDLIRRHRWRYFAYHAQQRSQWQESLLRQEEERVALLNNPSDAQFRSALVGDAFLKANDKYTTRPYDGDVCLFRPPLEVAHRLWGGRLLTHDRQFRDPLNHWGPHIQGKIEVYEVTGDHDSMMLEPHVRNLATKFKSCLDQANERVAAAASPLPSAVLAAWREPSGCSE
ncbi:polyketide synthase type I [Rhodopirellula maiorica SM1]|uniref:Phenolphthiocerol/phthiocerol polyketide synthase subunit E n=1 Tax=Rhodopirellula maiorica SM1 TaxID=1265738 RepID=M5RT75_9BACT|nr:type I polyketide synthase [Rhodopirellula maiorica]EMI17169.1 polyketide synthase type I [Rhodopirellula maiorica SM1]